MIASPSTMVQVSRVAAPEEVALVVEGLLEIIGA
jgi:hypothetical protein